MTDYMRCGDFVGHTDEESQFVGFYPMSENACDGYALSGGAMSPIEMPCSPLSEGSDWSMSSATTECMSQPTSPVPEEPRKPFKSSLKRHGSSSRPKMTVRWSVDTIFETRPLVKRRRSSPSSDDPETEEQDNELKAPIPTKKAKIAELENHAAAATVLHFLPSLSTTASSNTASSSTSNSFTPIFPDASRTVIPTFNFSSFVALGSNPTSSTAAQPTHCAEQTPALGRPRFEPFKFAAPKTISHSNLLVAAVNKI